MVIIPGCDIICQLCDVRVRVLKDNYLYLLLGRHSPPEGTQGTGEPYVVSEFLVSYQSRVVGHLELFSVLNSHMI
jgi:hypothetical protein